MSDWLTLLVMAAVVFPLLFVLFLFVLPRPEEKQHGWVFREDRGWHCPVCWEEDEGSRPPISPP